MARLIIPVMVNIRSKQRRKGEFELRCALLAVGVFSARQSTDPAIIEEKNIFEPGIPLSDISYKKDWPVKIKDPIMASIKYTGRMRFGIFFPALKAIGKSYLNVRIYSIV